MNTLLFYPNEVTEPGKAVLTGTRASYVHRWHAPKIGVEMSAIFFGRGEGRATLEESSESTLVFSVTFHDSSFRPLPVDLIISITRPQTVKKILQLSATFGVQSVHFVRSENVEKSYLQSKVLEQEALAEEVAKGLEQGGHPHAPEIVLHQHLYNFFDETLPGLQALNGDRLVQLIADTRESTRQRVSAMQKTLSSSTRVLLAIGPESGWTPTEVGRFLSEGFSSLWLSESQLRVETALSVALGQVELFLPRRSS